MLRLTVSRVAASFGLLVVGALTIGVTMGAGRQGPVSPALDKYSLMEVAADFPPGFQLWPEYRISKEAGPPNWWRGRWMGSTMKPGEAPSPRNKVLGGADVLAAVTDSPEKALEKLRMATSPVRLQVSAVPGSYSGRKIGDVCLHGGGHPSDWNAVLFFARGPVCFDIGVYGTARAMDAVERAAIALTDRVDAETALVASGTASVTAGGKQIAGRIPNGVALVHVKEFADATGAKASVDFPAGTATVTANGHTLLLHIGRKEAWLDGKPITLPFPALRNGRDQVWCPVDTLNSLGYGMKALSAKPGKR